MTRRKFIRRLTKAVVGIFAGISWIASKTPHRFVRAVPIKKYPGVLKHLEGISGPSKWSG